MDILSSPLAELRGLRIINLDEKEDSYEQN
jgi:hypothetical protein